MNSIKAILVHDVKLIRVIGNYFLFGIAYPLSVYFQVLCRIDKKFYLHTTLCQFSFFIGVRLTFMVELYTRFVVQSVKHKPWE